MKIIYSWGHHGAMKVKTENMIKRYVQKGYNITPINHREELGEDKTYTPDELYRLYHKRDPRLMQLYKKIANLAKTHDIFIVRYDNVYLPEFLKSLKDIYKVYFCDDDPEGSDVGSKPYVHAFDHSFAAAVNFDKNTKTWQKYLEWGAKRADWYPLSIMPEDYNPSLSVDNIYNVDRDIDLVYVGTHWLKLGRLVEIKKTFPQMKIYGRGWNWKALLASPLFHQRAYGNWDWRAFSGGIKSLSLGLEKVKELPTNELVPLYQRCKIGINIHESYGPCNRRMYQLPANGVMQICDCPEGLGQVFEIGKEVVVYHSIEEAIELIRYYLKHAEERKAIAAAGFERTMKEYNDLTIFFQVIEKIKRGMLEDSIKFFKDGESIELTENKV